MGFPPPDTTTYWRWIHLATNLPKDPTKKENTMSYTNDQIRTALINVLMGEYSFDHTDLNNVLDRCGLDPLAEEADFTIEVTLSLTVTSVDLQGQDIDSLNARDRERLAEDHLGESIEAAIESKLLDVFDSVSSYVDDITVDA